MRSARVMTFRVLMAPARTFRLLSRVISILNWIGCRDLSVKIPLCEFKRAEKLIGPIDSFQAKIWLYFDGLCGMGIGFRVGCGEFGFGMSKLVVRRGGLKASLLVSIPLVLLALILAWGGTYLWVDSSTKDLLYRQDQPSLAVARLERWSFWMFSPRSWRWLLADAYRKVGDGGRVKRLTDELSVSGLDPVTATAPLLLMESASGMPGRVKDNLGPLLQAYRQNGAEVLSALVQGFLSQGDVTGANQALRMWGELYEGDYQHEFWRGVLSTANYDLDEAVLAFKRSIAIKPDYARAHEELAEVFLEQAKFEEARTEFEWLLDRAEATPEILTSYARSLLNLGYPDLASEQLAKLKDPTKLPSPELSLVCEANLESGNVQLASEQAAILLQRWPNALPYLQLQARCRAKLGMAAESEALFARAAESQNQRPRIDDMLERLQTDALNTELRRDMGEMMMNYLDPSGGVGYIQVASRADPGDLKSHDLIATYMEREGKWDAAENHRRAIRQIQQILSDAMESQLEGMPEGAGPEGANPELPPVRPSSSVDAPTSALPRNPSL